MVDPGLNNPPHRSFWHGVVTNVALYTAEALSDVRIAAHFDAGAGGWHKSQVEDFSLYLNGKSWIKVPASPALQESFSSFTVEAWVNLASKRRSNIVVSAGGQALMEWRKDGSIYCNTPGTDPDLGVWRTGVDLQVPTNCCWLV